jgi:hypothetical protein
MQERAVYDTYLRLQLHHLVPAHCLRTPAGAAKQKEVAHYQ